jgi:L-lactate utilization protein LutC
MLSRMEGEPVPLPKVPNVSPAIDGDLWKLFQIRLEEVGGRIIQQDEIAALSSKLLWVEKAAEGVVKLKSTTDSIWDAEIGVSVAAFGIAETGSLVFESQPGTERLSSLIPPVNVVIVSAIVGTVSEAINRLAGGNLVITTGSSRTADIEGVLVRGVHGPRELLVYRVTSQ